MGVDKTGNLSGGRARWRTAQFDFGLE